MKLNKEKWKDLFRLYYINDRDELKRPNQYNEKEKEKIYEMNQKNKYKLMFIKSLTILFFPIALIAKLLTKIIYAYHNHWEAIQSKKENQEKDKDKEVISVKEHSERYIKLSFFGLFIFLYYVNFRYLIDRHTFVLYFHDTLIGDIAAGPLGILLFSKTFYFALIIIFVFFEIYKRKYIYPLKGYTPFTPELKKQYREEALKNNEYFLGVLQGNDKKKIMLKDKAFETHAQVIGTTGGGKTESILIPRAINIMQRGKGFAFIDPKGARHNLQKIKHYYQKYNCKQKIKVLDLANPQNTNTYNPLLFKSARAIRDMIIGYKDDWGHSFYVSEVKKNLLMILDAVVDIFQKKITFNDLHHLLTHKDAVIYIEKQLRNAGYTDKADDIRIGIIENWTDFQKGVSSLVSLLQEIKINFPMTNTYNPDISITEAYVNQEIIFFLLPTQSLRESAQAFGKMILLDFQNNSAKVDAGMVPKKSYEVNVDEFSEFATQLFVGGLNKARSSGTKYIMLHQSYGDLMKIDHSLAQQIADNTNTKIVFRVNDSTTAKSIQLMSGAKDAKIRSHMVENNEHFSEKNERESVRNMKQAVLDTDRLMKYPTGHAGVILKNPEHRVFEAICDYYQDPTEEEKANINLDFSPGEQNQKVDYNTDLVIAKRVQDFMKQEQNPNRNNNRNTGGNSKAVSNGIGKSKAIKKEAEKKMSEKKSSPKNEPKGKKSKSENKPKSKFQL
ncbi:type IV secretory system conjugative DNA transfer family protein [Halanaerobium sp.]|uniref:type IV secretory system conjugative DNA transfer family protein n=1 Tax=Halanaerobium sp. TaxID=1895664 RepID=UPI000DE687BB|nr:TraM recognition domain-containing protein [Halanaerobium sp.]PUU87633.1 MAG: TraM recognition site of TraD and TraG [Halanaerobium sp.]